MSAEPIRIHDTARQIRESYAIEPLPLAFKQTALVHPFTQRRDIALTAPTYREPVSPAHELLNVLCEGDCLVPHFPVGRKLRTFDARIAADDGDYVLVEASAEMRRLINLWGAHDELWARKYAAGVADTWVKQLRVLDGIGWMVERWSALPIGRCTVLGVLVNHRGQQ
jgi:hypothetical protein